MGNRTSQPTEQRVRLCDRALWSRRAARGLGWQQGGAGGGGTGRARGAINQGHRKLWAKVAKVTREAQGLAGRVDHIGSQKSLGKAGLLGRKEQGNHCTGGRSQEGAGGEGPEQWGCLAPVAVGAEGKEQSSWGRIPRRPGKAHSCWHVGVPSTQVTIWGWSSTDLWLLFWEKH